MIDVLLHQGLFLIYINTDGYEQGTKLHLIFHVFDVASPSRRGHRTTQRNGTPLPVTPHAVSTRSRSLMHARLPKLTYSTAFGGHDRQLVSWLLSEAEAGENLWSGPTSNTGTARARRRPASSRSSSAANVFSMRPEEAITASTARACISRARAWPSSRKLIRSRTRYGGSSRNGMSSCASASTISN
jgi:hypothetical protein